MSFAPARSDISAARLQAALPAFLVIWLTMAVILLGLSYVVKVRLQDADIRDVEDSLNTYLADRPVTGLMGMSGRRGESGAMQGLAFIRFVKEGEQLLLSESSPEVVDFHRLAGLDPRASGAWISLAGPGNSGPWTIVARQLASGFSVQAGKYKGLSPLYAQVAHFFWIAAFAAGIPALLVALASVRRGLSPIKRLSADIASILEEGGTALLTPPPASDRDLASLYQRLNQLLRNNRQLIAEMQASLDNVAHDLRTPMTRLRAVAEYALQPDREPEQLRDALSDCLEESERVLSMLRIMMSVAEAEAGTMHLQKEEVDLAESLADVAALYEYVAEDKNITVESRLAPGLLLSADRTRIAQVWANLLDNGIKYGKEGGLVRISSEADGDSVLVVFTDDGMGISKGELPRIWERLYRGDRSRSQPGLGLGLNYARAVVEAHGGTVAVESELHQGARFTVRLPRILPESGAGSVRSRSQISGA
jgi:signal transduction histidine kinase